MTQTKADKKVAALLNLTVSKGIVTTVKDNFASDLLPTDFLYHCDRTLIELDNLITFINGVDYESF